MKRTTIMLPPSLKLRAERQARKLNMSLGQFIREAIDARLSESKLSRSDDPLFSDKAVFDGEGPDDVALNHDRYLYEDET